ncbi:gephyrin-like molybdotransferase Glp [Methyloversatilis sp. XJ19-49]|uniref:molybdopterin molybdotransferase MoeA n=1 Tax=Methyloversatilis sp. XJ19-49 TaxID=2963429 RepID=UPI00211B9175|nr:gephyrin-like molybdotransferase Glp [Methyloversatilis sp. XJ19-49]MCQ9377610.1 molybdopterin molybdotransferase MoeA [Methyloversatilis sp. XJ19-49]
MNEMLTLDAALARLLASARPIGDTETVSTFHAAGRVLARDQRSAITVPPHDNSSMDGYAVRVADLESVGDCLPVSQRIPAGHVGKPLAPRTCARIFTGAPVPAGADAIVMQEATRTTDAGVCFDEIPKIGAWIRRAGEDIRNGDTVLAAGSRLRAQEVGLAASVGLADLPVVRRPRVALFSTGDELVMPGQPLPPGAIYNSNRYLLRALCEALGCEVLDLGIVPDRLDATRAALREAAATCDVILTSGGVGVGEEDHIKPALEAEGGLDSWKIAMKPGKPLAHGHVKRSDGSMADFLGLPGNPVSSFVTFLLLVRPFILRRMGVKDVTPVPFMVRADFDWPKPDRRREFLRVRRTAAGGLELFDNQSSGVLTSTVWGDGLADIVAGHTIARGDAVPFLSFESLLY